MISNLTLNEINAAQGALDILYQELKSREIIIPRDIVRIIHEVYNYYTELKKDIN